MLAEALSHTVSDLQAGFALIGILAVLGVVLWLIGSAIKQARRTKDLRTRYIFEATNDDWSWPKRPKGLK